MIARITSFAKKENQIVDWLNIVGVYDIDYLENLKKLISDVGREELDRLLRQLEILLRKYPEALNEENILKRSRALIEYVKDRNLTLNDCYSYINGQKGEIYEDTKIGEVNRSIYGIRVFHNLTLGGDDIVITGYDSTTSGNIWQKNQLNLRLVKDKLVYVNMLHANIYRTVFYSADCLEHIRPNILTKHL